MYSMTSEEAGSWKALTEVIKNFLGNKKAKNHKDLLKKLLSSCEEMGCNKYPTSLFEKPCRLFPKTLIV